MNLSESIKPIATLTPHPTEGFALDWSPTVPGRLATGDCSRHIYVHDPRPGGEWATDLRPFAGHTASVEDIQWSPTEPDVFASCGVDRTVRVWDARQRGGPALTCEGAHADDVNVISWSRAVAFLIASGCDDGSFKIWDLRKFGGGGFVRRSFVLFHFSFFFFFFFFPFHYFFLTKR
jgi:ribosome assembly protein RRB1